MNDKQDSIDVEKRRLDALAKRLRIDLQLINEEKARGSSWHSNFKTITFDHLEDLTSLALARIESLMNAEQVMGRVHNDEWQGKAALNSIGRQLPDGAPLYAAPQPSECAVLREALDAEQRHSEIMRERLRKAEEEPKGVAAPLGLESPTSATRGCSTGGRTIKAR